jgi:hypothetical protein
MIYFVVSVLVLAILLWFPASKLIWIVSVRRLQKKLRAEIPQAQIDGQYARARFIAIFVSLLFSFLFNAQLLGIPSNG